MADRWIVDANEAVARVAYALSEVIAIYPITPASPMAEHADVWMSARRANLWGVVPEVIQMQSEAGAAAAVHGALQAGALSTTFTASQGLLLMIPSMYKIAGELTPAVLHIAARTVATHALSIFGDHSDVMACRSTGWAMLCASSVQEAPDMALISHVATLATRVPFMHFFDGFRTSHEVNSIQETSDATMQAMLDWNLIEAHRARGLTPDRPVLRGSAQNPDVFFQAREAINPFYDRTPRMVQASMDRLASLTGRAYRLFDYYGDPQADRVLVLMGSAIGACEEAVDFLRASGQRVGVVKVRLYRPFDAAALVDVLPESVRRVAVLDRVKDPGAVGEPLYQDVVTALSEQRWERGLAGPNVECIIGGRYGLASKEFTPHMAVSIFDQLGRERPQRGFTVGIEDDVTHRSLKVDNSLELKDSGQLRAVFFGLGSDGTVSAIKSTAKIVGKLAGLHAQAYFVYDSKKSGAMTISHLRLDDQPLRASTLIQQPNFLACHRFAYLERFSILDQVEHGATVLLNSPYPASELWQHLPSSFQRICVARQVRLLTIDADALAIRVGLPGRISTIMQTCFFVATQVVPLDQALEAVRQSIASTYGKRGLAVVDKNHAAIELALQNLQEVALGGTVDVDSTDWHWTNTTTDTFVARVTGAMLAGLGNHLPVSAMPIDGTFPTGTASLEKRSIALEIPQWIPDLCIQCGLCAMVCPHAAIRTKVFATPQPASGLPDGPVSTVNADMPDGFASLPWKTTGSQVDGQWRMTLQVAPDDCTGCGVCVDVCPARSKEAVKVKAINMTDKQLVLDQQRRNYAHFLNLPDVDRRQIDTATVKGSQLLLPLFEYSGACAGCGETPYLKLLSQLFGDRAVIANATGCSSIFGGNLPTTPWSKNSEGRGPAWVNSLFEDNAEFGLGIHVAIEKRRDQALRLLGQLSAECLSCSLTQQELDCLASNPQLDETQLEEQRRLVRKLAQGLTTLNSEAAQQLLSIVDALVKKSVWIIGGDGWAHDIGFGGLDHVLASGRNVNILVLDTEVYSNTGGQASKSTPRAAIAKFAAAGKAIGKKDIGMLAMAYGHVYVAQIALGAHPLQALKAFHEAESYDGPSLIMAYSQCIAHGIDLSTGMTHQKDAVKCGYWPLYRYDPRVAQAGSKPFHLDCRKPTLPFSEFAAKEARFSMLQRSDPERARHLMQLAQHDIDDRWNYYEQISNVERSLAAIHDGVPE